MPSLHELSKQSNTVAFAKSQKVTIGILFENVCQGMKLFPMISRRGGEVVVWSWVVGIRMSWVEKIRKINLRERRERRLLGAQEYLPTTWNREVLPSASMSKSFYLRRVIGLHIDHHMC